MELLFNQLEAVLIQKAVMFRFDQKSILHQLELREKELKIQLAKSVPNWKKYAVLSEMHDAYVARIDTLCKKLSHIFSQLQYAEKNQKVQLENEKNEIIHEIELLESQIGS